MPLSDAELKNAKAQVKPYRLFDGHGLYVEVATSGSKLWRLKYRFDTKEKRLALGSYPATSLAKARSKALEARSLLEEGIDPSVARQRAKQAQQEAIESTFERVARDWHAAFAPRLAKSTRDKQLRMLERDLFPWLGNRPIDEIQPKELLACVRRIDNRGSRETSHRVRQTASQIFRFAVANDLCTRDPAADIKGAIPPATNNHFPALTDPLELGAYLRAASGFGGTPQVRAALILLPLLFVRPGELRAARWADIDLERAEWRYTASKTNSDHLVPLARQSLEVLEDLRPVSGSGIWVFPGGRGPVKPLSEAALSAALRRMGYDTRSELTPHGFRATARTLLSEKLRQKPEVIEHQLAHRVPDCLGRVYNRTLFLDERRRMMQMWADYLDRLRERNIVTLHARKVS